MGEPARIRSNTNRRGAATRGVRDKFTSVPVEDISFRVERPYVTLRRYRELGCDVALHLDPGAAGLHLVYVVVSVGGFVAAGDPWCSASSARVSSVQQQSSDAQPKMTPGCAVVDFAESRGCRNCCRPNSRYSMTNPLHLIAPLGSEMRKCRSPKTNGTLAVLSVSSETFGSVLVVTDLPVADVPLHHQGAAGHRHRRNIDPLVITICFAVDLGNFRLSSPVSSSIMNSAVWPRAPFVRNFDSIG